MTPNNDEGTTAGTGGAHDQGTSDAGDEVISSLGFHIVGVGSSAGGLEATTRFLEALPEDPGVAIVVVHHSDPSQKSQLAELLQRKTDLPVSVIEPGERPEPDHVYVCASNRIVEIQEGRFDLEPVEDRGQQYGIDRLFTSLANAYGSHAIGVVLSGTLSDGTLGCRALQARGGVTLVQDEASADYPSMPRNVADAGHADFVLSPEEIADKVIYVTQHRHLSPLETGEGDVPKDVLKSIFEHVREATGVDFTNYKRATLLRRIHRRMMSCGASSPEAYLEILESDPEEAKHLHDESLIHVTGFFRDAEMYEALREQVFPELTKASDADRPIRIWVPGCATGEEAYSLAIVLDEYLEDEALAPSLQLFGTDLSGEAIRTARRGRYPKSIEEDVPPERLQRYFVKDEGQYRIRESIRNACVFARQDLINDPPFSTIDLISCRNVLIYLEADLQASVASTLNYALTDDGFLVLGASESIERFSNLFSVVDSEHKIYRKRPGAQPEIQGRMPADRGLDASSLMGTGGGEMPPETDLRDQANQVALDTYAPPGFVVDANLEIVQFRGDVGRYLSPVEGQASLDTMRVAPQPLAMAIRSAVDEVQRDGRPVRREEITFDTQGDRVTVDLNVIPIRSSSDEEARAYLINFEGAETAGGSHSFTASGVAKRAVNWLESTLSPRPSKEEQARTEELEAELEATRQYLQSVIDDYEATTEELRSANEEALSTNEELQSTNEELETAKEELQSTNEELTTVNEELRERNEEIEKINNDLINLINSVGLPIVMLGPNLRIRRFTPQAEELLNLLESDIGRPLDDLRLPFDGFDFKKQILDVLDSLNVEQLEIEDEEGDGYHLRIHPYRTQDDQIDGAVLVFWSVD